MVIALNWLEHTEKLHSKLSMISFSIRRVRHITDEEDCHTAYHALFASHLCFGIAACNQDMQKILNLEKKTSELSTNCPPVSHTSKKKKYQH